MEEREFKEGRTPRREARILSAPCVVQKENPRGLGILVGRSQSFFPSPLLRRNPGPNQIKVPVLSNMPKSRGERFTQGRVG